MEYNTSQNVWALPSSSNLNMENGHVHLWKVPILENGFYINQLKNNLSQDELNHAEKFYQDKDRRCYITARGILRQLLSRYINKPNEKILFNYNEFGKPFLPLELNSLAIQFNVSHSNNLIIFAFTLEKQIGVDVELIKPMSDMDSIAESVFSNIEYDFWREAPEEKKLQLFFRFWTYKEAFIKAIGSGFSYNTKNFSLIEMKEYTKIIIHDKEKFVIPDLWTMESIQIESAYCAAYATSQPISQVNCFEWV